MNKNFILTYLLTAIFLFSIAGVIAYQQQKINSLQSQKIPIITPVSADVSQNEVSTKAWKTFKNNQLGFEIFFQYPQSFVSQEMVKGLTTRETSLVCLSETKNPNYRTSALCDIVVRIIPVTSHLMFESAIIDDVIFAGSGFHPKSFNELKKKKIGDKDFYYIITGRNEGELTASYYYVNNDIIVVFDLYDTPADWQSPNFNFDKNSLNLKFQQILSTFKFTDSTSSTDISIWKSYSSKKLNFQIKYPSLWKITSAPDYDFVVSSPDYKVDSSASPSNGSVESGAAVSFSLRPLPITDFVTNRCNFLKVGSPNLDCKQEIMFNLPAAVINRDYNNKTNDKTIFIEKDKYLFEINFSQNINAADFQSETNLTIFDQILSTFKFTN